MKKRQKRRGVVYFKDLQEYAQKYFGKSIPFECIEDQEAYAEVFAEGCIELKKILLLLWSKGYATTGCCKGHELPETYICTTSGKRIQRMTPQEYKQKQQAPFFLRPHGFCKGPEYTTPYIQLNGITEKDAMRLQKTIRSQMHWKADENYTSVSKTQFSIHFENYYDETGKIDNSLNWGRILLGFEKFLHFHQKRWKEGLQLSDFQFEKPKQRKETENNQSWLEREEEPNK